MARYWDSNSGDTHWHSFIFASGAWGDQRPEMEAWLASKFKPLLHAKDLCKLVRYDVFLFPLFFSLFAPQVVKKKSDMRTNMSTRLIVGLCKVYCISDEEGKVSAHQYIYLTRYLLDV